MTPKRTLIAALSAIAVLTLGACGIPTGQDSFDRIGADEVPFRLAEQSTTTSTTTTTMPPTTTTDPAVEEPPETTIQETTTTLPLETVSIYFLSDGELQPVPFELPQGYGINQLAAGLEAGPPQGSAGIGLDTLIAEGLILDSTPERGVVTVELDETELDRIQPREVRFAIAQIVLTYTANLRGVGQVSFTIDGEPVRVQRGNGLLSDPGEALSFDDYAGLLTDARAAGDSNLTPAGGSDEPSTGTIPADDEADGTGDPSVDSGTPTSTTTTAAG